jgi:hypothetical protein
VKFKTQNFFITLKGLVSPNRPIFLKNSIRIMEKLDYYDGQVLNGKFHGKGKFTSSKGIIAEGSFEHGYLDGQVSVSFPDGRIYHAKIKERVAIENTLVQGKTETTKTGKPKSPFQPGPGPKTKPKGTIFHFLGMDFKAE